MDEVICTFGVSSHLHRDHGSNFENNICQSLCNFISILLCKMVDMAKSGTIPFAPWSKGETDRMNKTRISVLKRMVEEDLARESKCFRSR